MQIPPCSWHFDRMILYMCTQQLLPNQESLAHFSHQSNKAAVALSAVQISVICKHVCVKRGWVPVCPLLSYTLGMVGLHWLSRRNNLNWWDLKENTKLNIKAAEVFDNLIYSTILSRVWIPTKPWFIGYQHKPVITKSHRRVYLGSVWPGITTG